MLRKNNIPSIRGIVFYQMHKSPSQGWIDYSSKNQFGTLELLFVVLWIFVNTFFVRKLCWWNPRVLKYLFWRSENLWSRHNMPNALENWCQEMKIYHYSKGWYLWKTWYKVVGLAQSTCMVYKWEIFEGVDYAA